MLLKKCHVLLDGTAQFGVEIRYFNEDLNRAQAGNSYSELIDFFNWFL